MTPHILVVDDDAQTRQLIADYLGTQEYRVSPAADGREMTRLLAESAVDLIVLDLKLPGEDGLSLARKLRAESDIPIIMLTGQSDPIDRVVGLELGADDYLTKPFNPRELLARVRAILRRTRGETKSAGNRRHAFEKFVMDLDARTLQGPDGEEITLTSAEFDLLACFIERPRRVLSREQLLDWTRGREADPFDRTIDMAISRLRKKFDTATPGCKLISTIRNNGYLFMPQVSPVP